MSPALAIPEFVTPSLQPLWAFAAEYNAIMETRGAEVAAIEQELARADIGVDHRCETPFLVTKPQGTAPGHTIERAYRLELEGFSFWVQIRERVIEVPTGKLCDTRTENAGFLKKATREIRTAALRQMPAFLAECRAILAEKLAQAKAEEAE